MTKPLKLALALICTAGTVSAEPITGNILLEACNAKDDIARQGFCVGYLIGVVEGLRYGATVPLFVLAPPDGTNGNQLKEMGEIADKFLGFCAPPEAQYSQHSEIVINYLSDHPETRHESARTLAILALKEAFPCAQ